MTRKHRTIPVDFRHEATYDQLLDDTKACIECVLALRLARGCPLLHTARGSEGGGPTRHAHDARVRLGGLTLWRIQCTTCTAVCTVLPHGVLRDRTRRPEIARDALGATHGRLRLAWGAVIGNIHTPP